MKRIGTDIILTNEYKTDYVLNMMGQPTEETYTYREYYIVDDNGDTLEIGRWTLEEMTVELICQNTGIVLGVSEWIS